MTILRTSAVALALLIPATSFAKTLNDDFQTCALAALQERQQSAATVSVKTSGLSHNQLDHDNSAHQSTYRMQITDKVSGADLGTVTCKVNTAGNLIAASFD